MRATPTIATFVAVVLMSACSESGNVTEPADDPLDSALADTVQPQLAGSVIAQLSSPTGSSLSFMELTAGNVGGVLVVEEGAEGTLVTDRVFDAAGRHLSAAELYVSLADPDAGVRIPARLLELSKVAAPSQPAGWALAALRNELPSAQLSSASAAAAVVACNNASFTGSIGGGFLARTKKRLDTGPALHPNLWPHYSFYAGPWPNPYPFYRYRAAGWAVNTPLWRGKVCGKAPYRPPVAPIYQGYTYLNFMYRYGGQWWIAGGASFLPENGTKVVGWYYDGGIGRIDWDIAISDAYYGDQFDLLMTYN